MNYEPTRKFFLIDGSHYDRLRSVFGAPFDLNAIATLAFEGERPTRAFYYRDVRDAAEEQRQSSLFGWLSHNGFDVKGRRYDPSSSTRRERYGTNLVALTVDAMALACDGDAIAIMASDIKLVPLLTELRGSGVTIVLVSTKTAKNTIAAPDELIDLADRFVDLAEIEDRLQ